MVGLAVAFVAVAVVGSHNDLAAIGAPPFYGSWRNGLGATVVAPIVVAFVVIAGADRLDRIAWPWVVVVAVLAALAWSVAIGVADNVARLTHQLHSPAEYTRGLGAIGDHPGHYLDTFAEAARGPSSEVIRRGYPTHVQGHPPGGVLTLWALTRLGLSTIHGAILMVWSGIALTVVAVLGTVRRVAGDAAARVAVPFVVLVPAAVWSHAFDSFFAGVGACAAWAVVAAVVAERDLLDGRSRPRTFGLAAVGGVLFGYVGLLSYGLLVLALVPVAVAWHTRRARSVVVAGGAAVVTMALPAAWGFNWFAGLATTHHQYQVGVSQRRPYAYFVLANLVIVAMAVGPAAIAGSIVGARRWIAKRVARFPGIGALVVGGGLAVLVADVTGLAKGEVERIFQPFFPWLALAAIGITAETGRSFDRPARAALGCQALVAIALATQLRSPW